MKVVRFGVLYRKTRTHLLARETLADHFRVLVYPDFGVGGHVPALGGLSLNVSEKRETHGWE